MSDPKPDLVRRLRAAGCVFAEEEAELLLGAAPDAAALESMVERRVAGLPLEHVLGWVEFCGRRYAVAPGVFVPRRRTELLVREALAATPVGGTVLDLGCGCGAIGGAIADGGSGVEVYAVDIDPAAVACARRNLDPGRVYQGDLYDALPERLRGRVDVIVANAPYVPTDAMATMPPEARLHEPRVALDGGADGLDVLRRVIAGAPGWLGEGGHLLVEVGEDQVPAATAALDHSGLSARVVRDDELDATVVVGTIN